MDQTLSLRYAALSDVGRVRKDNQDSGFAGPHLLMVADGVGGAARGDVASSTAVQILRRLDAPAPEDTHEALAGAIHRAHDRIAELVEEDPELDGTSTTVTAALFDGRKLSVAHVGDSRGYLLRDGTLAQLTKDHTFVQSLIDEGRLTEEESRTHPHRNLILRAVDGVHDTDPDLFDVELAAGDRILLCSDGASGVLEPDRLTDILSTGSVDYAVVELIRAALEAGSSDNITCVVADVVADDAATAEDPEAAAATTGPMLVGAAAEQPRRGGAGGMAKSLFRGHRSGDTGELEPVPGAPGDPEDIDPEELRYAPRPPRRFRWARRIALLVVVLVVLAVAATFAYRWSQRQYYVAAVGNKVAVYRGVEATVPGLTMHAPVTTSPITLQSLDEYTAEQVRDGIAAKSRQDAADIVERLRTVATACPTPEPTPTTSPKKSPKPSGKATGGSTARSTAKAVATATPSAQASGSPAPSSTQSASPSPAPSPTP
ncbi:MAG: PP2C family protein-serine/threonine phosphatase, partial [Nocardioidaceae bacterium]